MSVFRTYVTDIAIGMSIIVWRQAAWYNFRCRCLSWQSFPVSYSIFTPAMWRSIRSQSSWTRFKITRIEIFMFCYKEFDGATSKTTAITFIHTHCNSGDHSGYGLSRRLSPAEPIPCLLPGTTIQGAICTQRDLRRWWPVFHCQWTKSGV